MFLSMSHLKPTNEQQWSRNLYVETLSVMLMINVSDPHATIQKPLCEQVLRCHIMKVYQVCKCTQLLEAAELYTLPCSLVATRTPA